MTLFPISLSGSSLPCVAHDHQPSWGPGTPASCWISWWLSLFSHVPNSCAPPLGSLAKSPPSSCVRPDNCTSRPDSCIQGPRVPIPTHLGVSSPSTSSFPSSGRPLLLPLVSPKQETLEMGSSHRLWAHGTKNVNLLASNSYTDYMWKGQYSEYSGLNKITTIINFTSFPPSYPIRKIRITSVVHITHLSGSIALYPGLLITWYLTPFFPFHAGYAISITEGHLWRPCP